MFLTFCEGEAECNSQGSGKTEINEQTKTNLKKHTQKPKQ